MLAGPIQPCWEGVGGQVDLPYCRPACWMAASLALLMCLVAEVGPQVVVVELGDLFWRSNSTTIRCSGWPRISSRTRPMLPCTRTAPWCGGVMGSRRP